MDNIDVIKQAYNSKKPLTIDFKTLHKYMETSLKLKGYLLDNKSQTQVNVGLVVQRD